MGQATANEWIYCKKLKAPKDMIGFHKVYEHHPEEREKTIYHNDSFSAKSLFLLLSWLPSAVPLQTFESVLSLGII